jgi:hypothetical protein
MENVEKIDKLLDTHEHPKLNQEDIHHVSRYITSNEIEASLPKKSRT